MLKVEEFIIKTIVEIIKRNRLYEKQYFNLY